MPGGMLGWLARTFRPSELPASEAQEMVLAEITRAAGWKVRCELGADVARALGSTGTIAKCETSTVGLDLQLAFELDDGFEPAQGSVVMTRSSRFFEPCGGYWQVDATSDEDVPTAIKWRLSCTGLEAGGECLVPCGPLYFNALVQPLARAVPEGGSDEVKPPVWGLAEGRLTVKEALGSNAGLFNARGILAEFKIIGSFEVEPAS